MWWSDWWGGYAPGHWMFFGPVMLIIFAILCIAVMFFMMRGGAVHGDRGARALEILKERYARGEIDQAEFEERRRFLEA